MELQAPGIGMGIILGMILLIGNVLALYAMRAAAAGEITPDSSFAGIRTAAVRSTDATWRAAHEAAWPWSQRLNGAAALGAIVTATLGATVAPFLIAAGATIALTIAGAITTLVVGDRTAREVLGER
ncbi:MAG: hypothetical protein GXX90_04710 [Microbacteriaceae bacterium]|nr:hypothetical protein [Microbacteriaceae bacterium]